MRLPLGPGYGFSDLEKALNASVLRNFTINALLHSCWACIVDLFNFFNKNKLLYARETEILSKLLDNRQYYLDAYQKVSDAFGDTNTIIKIDIWYLITKEDTNAFCSIPRKQVFLHRSTVKLINDGNWPLTARTLLHELARVYGGQVDTGTGQPGDVEVYDRIGDLLYTYRDTIIKCCFGKK